MESPGEVGERVGGKGEGEGGGGPSGCEGGCV